MTVEEIFSKLSAHMIKGMMAHEQFANMYQFLGLDGCKCCHDYHFLAETIGYRKLLKFYINKYNKLVPEGRVEDPGLIPDNWYKYTRQDVDAASKRTYIKNLLSEWHNWEKDTYKYYHDMCKELENLYEYAAADYVKCLMCDVEEEIMDIEKKMLKLGSVDYSMTFIIGRQKHLEEKYREKKKELLN